MRKSNGVKVHNKKEPWVRVDHEKKSDGGKSIMRKIAMGRELTMRKRAIG